MIPEKAASAGMGVISSANSLAVGGPLSNSFSPLLGGEVSPEVD